MTHHIFTHMLGRTIISVTGGVGDSDLILYATDGSHFEFYHAIECCESVQIADICGDLNDLLYSPILQAEEVSNLTYPPDPTLNDNDCSFTWSFYKFATMRGSVTVSWLGTSNGCYSEKACYRYVDNAYKDR